MAIDDPPSWVKDAIFYQIFVDRFAKGSAKNYLSSLKFKDWGTPPQEQGFQGGDLWGIIEKLDYLQELNVNALYLTPIFSSASNHRYHTYNHFEVDPLLGGMEAFQLLLNKAHKRGIRVIIDGVFNHVGRGFWPFHHIIENGPSSPYVDWFRIHSFPINFYPSSSDTPPNYACWANDPALPQLNHHNKDVINYLLEVGKFWTQLGVDGWRLDAPHEIGEEFWRLFRQETRKINPEIYLCGEYWFIDKNYWLGRGLFDALTNYPFAQAAMGFFAAKTLCKNYENGPFKFREYDATSVASFVEEIHRSGSLETNLSQLNILSSHDMSRALHTAGGDESALRLAVMWQMTMPGAPCIYYGDEIGLYGGSDPDNREPFPWDLLSQQNLSLLTFYKKATHIRKTYPVLRSGDYQALYFSGYVYAFARLSPESTIIPIFNAHSHEVSLNLPLGNIIGEHEELEDLWGKKKYLVTEKSLKNLSLAPRSFLILHQNHHQSNIHFSGEKT